MSLPRCSTSLAEKVGKAYELFSIFLKYWRRNYGSRRNPDWKPLLTYVRRGDKYNYDLHYLDPNSSKDGLDGVSFYVTKYLLKYDDWVDRFKSKLFFSLPYEQFKDAWNLLRPRCLLSKGFGGLSDSDVYAYLSKGVKFSVDTNMMYPCFISRVSGATYPLAPYYSRKLLTPKLKALFRSRCPEDELTQDDINDFDKAQIHLDEMRKFLSSQATYIDFDDIDNINSIYYDYGQIPTDAQSDSCFADCWQDFDNTDNTDC